ncbi:MAG: biotin attachment protein [Planctomycetota bacterium]|nr:MAG: biotin attachment protein [Planctomycetota bacterium]
MAPRTAVSVPQSGTVRHRLAVPEVGIVGVKLVLSLWLVPEGSEVLEGDRVVELLGGGATIDLEAPVTGRLLRSLVEEDQPVATGEILAEFEATAEVDLEPPRGMADG